MMREGISTGTGYAGEREGMSGRRGKELGGGNEASKWATENDRDAIP